MCNRVISEDCFIIAYGSDTYKSQGMCDEAVDDSLAALRVIPVGFITSKMF